MRTKLLILTALLLPVFSVKANTDVVISEDFSKFTQGTENAPDATDIGAATNSLIPDNLTQTSGWVGKGVKQAGGSAFIDLYKYSAFTKSGLIHTPAIDLSGNGGAFTVSFRAKILDERFVEGQFGLEDWVVIECYDASDPTYALSKSSVKITKEWATYTVDLNKGIKNAYVQILTNRAKMLIDDIFIKSDGLSAPIPTGATNYKKGSGDFTVNWLPVNGATGYLVSVWYKDKDNKLNRIIVNAETTETHYDVKGLESNVQYSYTVIALKGDYMSEQSVRERVVVSMEPPKNTGATDVTDTGFTANWETVENAEGYKTLTYAEFTASKTTPYSIINTDFSTIKEGTTDSPTTISETFLDNYLDRAHWQASDFSALCAGGYFGLSNEKYAEYPGWYPIARILSPLMDFSKAGGKATIEFSAKTNGGEGDLHISFSTTDNDGYLIEVPTSKKTSHINNVLSKYTVELEGGVNNGVIQITLDEKFSGTVFFDDLKVTQTFTEGESVAVPVKYDYAPGQSATSKDIQMWNPQENERFFYKVYAHALDLDNEDIHSAPSEICYVERKALVKDAPISMAAAYAVGNKLHIENPGNEPVNVYSISGLSVYSDNGDKNTIELSLPTGGMYLVRIGNDSFKVISGL